MTQQRLACDAPAHIGSSAHCAGSNSPTTSSPPSSTLTTRQQSLFPDRTTSTLTTKQQRSPKARFGFCRRDSAGKSRTIASKGELSQIWISSIQKCQRTLQERVPGPNDGVSWSISFQTFRNPPIVAQNPKVGPHQIPKEAKPT